MIVVVVASPTTSFPALTTLRPFKHETLHNEEDDTKQQAAVAEALFLDLISNWFLKLDCRVVATEVGPKEIEEEILTISSPMPFFRLVVDGADLITKLFLSKRCVDLADAS